MTYTDKHIIEAYSGLLENLPAESKKELIKKLSESLPADEEETDRRFYGSFGAFASDKSAEEIVADIRDSRHFRNKDIQW